MSRKPLLSFALMLAAYLQAATVGRAEDDSAGVDFFEKKIRPVLVQKCYQCHSADADAKGKLKGGLLVDSREAIRRGGDSGPSVVPKDAKKSLLLSALRHDEFEMPPQGKLPDPVIADFEKWIAMGAPDPRVEQNSPVQKSIDLDEGRKFWSFQPIKKFEPPKAKDDRWSVDEIDRLIFEKLREMELKPVEDADGNTLIRRLFFDLTGLPPTVEDLEQWSPRISKQSSLDQTAVGELVDQLLSSPRFGEHWGRHWLDVARFAESNGNTRNATFPHAWRYRDYVIDAFNSDTPYDRFITEQLAGDLLEANDADARNRNRIATGFLALASKPVIRGKNGGGFVPDIAADQIEVTSRAFLGLTVACARCHDHKFDPIPTTDYYALAGIFASSQTLYGGGGNTMGAFGATGLHDLESKDPRQAQAFAEWKQQIAELSKRQKDLATQLKKARAKRPKGKGKAARQDATEAEAAPRLAELTAQSKQVAAQLKELRAKKLETPGQAMGVRESGKTTEVPVYVRGESPKGAAIPRGFVSIVASETSNLPSDQSGRLELAQWLTAHDNPLTARVMVNRIWLHLFGEGVVRTADNFGINGDRPSHPELLDLLASEFMADGWSIKRMIRRIVLTRTYQMSSNYDAQNYEADPDNIYVWRHSQRRMQAESIRDSILAASGQLERDRPHGSNVTQFNETLIQDNLTPDKIHSPSRHRSVYLPMLRNGLPEMMEVFDVADPSLVVGRRNVTTVPAQDLYLMNSPFVIEQSQHFAQLLLESAPNDTERVTLAYRRSLSRDPSREELSRALAFVSEAFEAGAQQAGQGDAVTHVWSRLCQALFVSAEFRHTR